MKCPHVDECKQKVASTSYEELCLGAGNVDWYQEDCFKYDDLKKEDAWIYGKDSEELKTPNEWKKKFEAI